MENLISFISENYILLGVVLIVLIIVVNVLKTILKWVIFLVVVGGVLIYGFNYSGDTIKNISQQTIEYAKEEAVNLLAKEIKDAEYTENEDGTYTITTKNLRLEGKLGSDEAKLTFKGVSIDIKLDDVLKKLVDQIKNQA